MTYTQWVAAVATAVGVMIAGCAMVLATSPRLLSRIAVTTMTTVLTVYAVLAVGLHR